MTALSRMGNGSRLENEPEMDYKNHQIKFSVYAAGDSTVGCRTFYVSYSEHGKGVLKSLRVDQTFASPVKAEQAGIAFAPKVDR